MRILIVEDDSDIVLILYRALRLNYMVDSVATVAGALKKLDESDYSAILLDLALSDGSGLSVCEKIREQGKHIPILILSGSADVIDKVKLLDSGANDYLTKPFNLEELKARLRVLLRQPATTSTARHRMVIGDLTLDSVKHQVERDGRNIDLRKKEFSVLECLMKNAGRVVSRNTLTDYAWDEQDYNLTNTVDVHIKYLRDKIDRPFEDHLIKTVHGLGYKIDASHIPHSNINKERKRHERIVRKDSKR